MNQPETAEVRERLAYIAGSPRDDGTIEMIALHAEPGAHHDRGWRRQAARIRGTVPRRFRARLLA